MHCIRWLRVRARACVEIPERHCCHRLSLHVFQHIHPLTQRTQSNPHSGIGHPGVPGLAGTAAVVAMPGSARAKYVQRHNDVMIPGIWLQNSKATVNRLSGFSQQELLHEELNHDETDDLGCCESAGPGHLLASAYLSRAALIPSLPATKKSPS